VPESLIPVRPFSPSAAAPTVSVIIPTRNRATVLARSMRSVLAQTLTSLELIIVDDASDDDTEAVVETINDARIRYIKCDQHGGAPVARNIGIRAASGRYLAFHDSDDEWLPMKLERQLQLLAAHAPAADVVTCGTISIDSAGRGVPVVAASETLSYEGLLAFRELPWSGPTILVRRTEATNRVLFDEHLPAGQDWDYVVRLARITRVVSVREPLVKVGRAAGDRISRHLRKLQGRRMLREKHDHELRQYPQALIAHEIGIGRLSISCGQYAEARHRIAVALRMSPLQPALVAMFVGAFLSQSTAIRRIFGRRVRAVVAG